MIVSFDVAYGDGEEGRGRVVVEGFWLGRRIRGAGEWPVEVVVRFGVDCQSSPSSPFTTTRPITFEWNGDFRISKVTKK